MDRLFAMRVFTAVVESGSFARAANQIGCSNTAASRSVAELERHLGARLLQRTTRRLSLTETGAAYFERSRQILADIDQAEAAASSAEAQLRGTLRVSLPHSFGLRYVAPLIPCFCAQHPELMLEITFSDGITDLVEEGIDMAIRIASELNTTLVARQLATIRFACCASPAYLERHGTPQTPEELRQHRGLAYSYAQAGDTWHFEKDGKAHAVAVKSAMRANSGEMLRHAGIAGMGIAIQPTFIVGDDLRSGSLVRLLADYELPPIRAWAVNLPGARRCARVKAFADFLQQAFAGEPAWDRGL